VLILHRMVNEQDVPPARTVLIGQIEVRQSSAPSRAKT
jgi:hypothetical protein